MQCFFAYGWCPRREPRQHRRNGLGITQASQGAEHGRGRRGVTLQQTEEHWYGVAITQRCQRIHSPFLDPPVRVFQSVDERL
jgi:hypothetical protein